MQDLEQLVASPSHFEQLHVVAQTILETCDNPPASASAGLGFQTCTARTTPFCSHFSLPFRGLFRCLQEAKGQQLFHLQWFWVILPKQKNS